MNYEQVFNVRQHLINFKYELSNNFVVDCVWGDWFSEGCSVTCSDGIEIFGRDILQKEMFGGKPCVGNSTRSEKCFKGDCPGTIIP